MGGTGSSNHRVGLLDDISGKKFNITERGTVGALSVQLVDASGAQITSFGGTQYAVDTALGATPTGTLSLGIRDDALSALTPVEGDAIGLRVDANGALWTHDDALDAVIGGSELQVDIVGALPAGTAAIGKLAANDGIDIGDVTINNASLAVTGTFWQATQPVSLASVPSHAVTNAGTFAVQAASAGDIAHDSVDSGNPLKIGAKAVLFDASAPPNAAAAEDDRVNLIADEYGRQYVETTHPNYFDVSADYATAQTNATVKAAPGVGLSLYITDIIISNGATAGNITLLDGSAGTVLIEIYPAINGGCSTNLRTPIKLTANTLLAITSTTVTTHSVTVSGFVAP